MNFNATTPIIKTIIIVLIFISALSGKAAHAASPVFFIDNHQIVGSNATTVENLSADAPSKLRNLLKQKGVKFVLTQDKPHDYVIRMTTQVSLTYLVFDARITFDKTTLQVEKDSETVFEAVFNESHNAGPFKTYGSQGERYAEKIAEFFAAKLSSPEVVMQFKSGVETVAGQSHTPATGLGRGDRQQVVQRESNDAYPDNEIDIEQKLPRGKRSEKYDVAVIIGNKNYTSTSAVDYAIRDARAMKDYAQKVMGFDLANIIYAEDAGLTKFYEFFGAPGDPTSKSKLRNYIKENVSSVFVYYVGHGAPDIKSGDAYFVPVDSDPMMIENSGYRVQTLYDKLAELPAKKIMIVLDSCFSGNSPKGLIFSKISALVPREKSPTIPKTDKLTIITSTSAQQVSSWYDEKKHSLFTYFFLKGVKGEADANSDGKISLGELKTYLAENVAYNARRATGAEQNPQVKGNDGDIIVSFEK